jgi:hypothetical protein
MRKLYHSGRNKSSVERGDISILFVDNAAFFGIMFGVVESFVLRNFFV